jgi:hypothetical protein
MGQSQEKFVNSTQVWLAKTIRENPIFIHLFYSFIYMAQSRERCLRLENKIEFCLIFKTYFLICWTCRGCEAGWSDEAPVGDSLARDLNQEADLAHAQNTFYRHKQSNISSYRNIAKLDHI